jgi:hypothetical protein
MVVTMCTSRNTSMSDTMVWFCYKLEDFLREQAFSSFGFLGAPIVALFEPICQSNPVRNVEEVEGSQMGFGVRGLLNL